MLKMIKIFGAVFGVVALVGAASAAANSSSEYGTPPSGGGTVVEQPTAGAQNITVKVKVRRGRGGTAVAQAPKQDVVVDGEDEDKYANLEADKVEEEEVEEEVQEEEAPRRIYAEERQNLAHPFFQPSEGKVAISLGADFALTKNEFTILDPYTPLGLDQPTGLQGKTFSWNGQHITYKAGAAYGVTDSFEVKGAVAFRNLKWTYEGRGENGGDIVMEDSGFDSWGLGLGWRAFEDEDFIFKLNAEYRAWETSNLIYLSGMGGIKRGNSTIYMGVAGLFYDNEGDTYGFGLRDEEGAEEFVEYEKNKNPMYVEGTLGLFTALSPDFSLDLNVTYAHLSWHNVISAGGAVAFQPTKSFAVMVYGQYILYDDSEGKDKFVMWSNISQTDTSQLAEAEPVSYVRLERPSQFVVGAGMKIYF